MKSVSHSTAVAMVFSMSAIGVTIHCMSSWLNQMLSLSSELLKKPWPFHSPCSCQMPVISAFVGLVSDHGMVHGRTCKRSRWARRCNA